MGSELPSRALDPQLDASAPTLAPAPAPIDGGADTIAPAPFDPAADTLGSARASASQPRRMGESLRRGDELGRYVVVDFLGAGGMGAVYSAYDPQLDRKVAIKVMLGGGSHEERMRLVREAQALAKLQHPNVVAVYDAGEHAGRVFVAMEFVRGKTLARWAADGTHDWRELVRIFAAAGRGLAAAHAEGLVHRDFKPDNVMLGDDGRVRVMDFGLARAHELEPTLETPSASSSALAMELTTAGAVMGTPAYMAPEQFAGRTCDARTDQFSFCVALYEALAGRRPFEGASWPELSANVCSGTRRSTAAIAQGHLRAVVERGLCVAPADRFASMDELLVALQRDPARRTRWIAGGVGVAIAIAGVVGVRQARRAQAEAACVSEGATIGEDWNAGAADRLRTALGGSGLAYGATTAEHVVAWLDPYAARWSELRETTCRAESIEHSIDSELRERAEDCLAERRAALAELVTQLEHADASLIEGAVVAASKLDTIESCADAGWLMQQPAVAPEQRAQSQALRERLARVSTLVHVGHYDDALAEVRSVVDEAEALGDAAVLARARLVTGNVLDTLGEFPAAEHELVLAEHEAGAIGADDVAASATRVLVQLAHRMDDPASGERWARRAQMWLDRLGAPADDVRRADLANHLGNIHHAAGRIELAGEEYRRALAIRRAVLGERHPSVAASLHNLGGYSYSRGDFDAAADYSLQALAIWEETLGLEHPDVAGTLSNLGAIESARGNTAAAIAQLERARELRERTLGPDHVDLATTLHNLGLAYLKSGDETKAKAALERALAIRRAALPADHTHLRSTIEALAKLR